MASFALSVVVEQLLDLDHQCRDQLMFKRNQNTLESWGRDMASTHGDNRVPQASLVVPGPFSEAVGHAF